MLIPTRDLQLIAGGRISIAFRRWRRPTVRSGGTLRTTIGVLAIESVEPVAESDITASEAKAAGYADLRTLRAALNKQTEGSLFRIRMHLQGADPRAALRNQSKLSADEVRHIRAKLERLDKSSRHGAWTLKVLRNIHSQPSRRAADLASQLGLEREWLKIRIRKLKELGLTESLEVGYRLSPRGEALLPLLSSGDA